MVRDLHANRFNARRFSALALAAALGLAAFAFPGSAAAADYEYGDMVDYPLVFPVQGDVSYIDSFWAARYNGTHHAQDLMAAKMTPVVAAASGRVEYVNGSTNPNDLRPHRCCSLAINHDDGWHSVYIHLNNDTPGTDDGEGWGIAPGLIPGSRVEAGQLIGWVGDSGNAESTPPHLHFELDAPGDIAVNPYNALRAAQGEDPPPRPTCEPGFSALLNAGVLRPGDRGEPVTDLQRFLDAAGYSPGSADGVYGPRTESAVYAFQRARGITADGKVGNETKGEIRALGGGGELHALLDPGAPVLRPFEARGESVRVLQEWLLIAGYDPNGADGIYGANTADAVRLFQEAAGLTTDGKVGPNTRRSLAAALGLLDLANCD
jgi:peptidoglycan hydrolase-like protein with peptidoglycan-binding domain